MDEDADNEASALTLRKLTPAPVEVVPEPEPQPEPIEIELPPFAANNAAFLFSEPDCTGKMWTLFPFADGSPFQLELDNFALYGLGDEIDLDIASMRVPEGQILTLWEDEFSGASKSFEGFLVEGLRVSNWGCHNVGMLDIATSLTYELAPPKPEVIIVPGPRYAMLYTDEYCHGSSYKMELPENATETKLDFWKLVFSTGIGNDNLSAVAVPEGYELIVFAEDFFGTGDK